MDAKQLGESRLGVFDDQIERTHHIDGYGSLGITLRQHFAGLAMQSLLTNYGQMENVNVSACYAEIAAESVAHADALLKQLAKET